MSLVDYAASSDEDEPQTPSKKEPEEKEEENNKKVTEGPVNRPHSGDLLSAAPPNPKPDPVHAHNRMSKNLKPPPTPQVGIVSNQSSELKLPDASFLLNSPAVSSHLLNASDHSSRVAAAMAENAARKRELNVAPNSYPRSKVPKGNLPHSKNVPDTIDGRLLPPQLAGRGNIVTEDMSKLFVRKNAKSSAE